MQTEKPDNKESFREVVIGSADPATMSTLAAVIAAKYSEQGLFLIPQKEDNKSFNDNVQQWSQQFDRVVGDGVLMTQAVDKPGKFSYNSLHEALSFLLEKM